MGSVDYTPDMAAAKPESQVLEKPSRSGRKLRIICLGAGASALNLAHEIDISPLDLELVCYEKNPSIGGSCEWTSFYSGAPETLQYFKDVAEKFDLNKYIRLNHRVVGAYWNEEDQMWHVKIQKGDDPDAITEDKANIFVNASGVLKYVDPSHTIQLFESLAASDEFFSYD
ncbi:hypothetical protein INS49_007456 [Diaporthe citri]|uniref:uncharacterized protein n=1 Tax=Diaporthe citri TaxID=83186 RepID=UPI001C7F0434|nr:uncharacterized protein INS49_007456 [Diaporthe citri]KAG6353376.1 hypothetical protein INS49_007456 [Diaporthe citri]